MMDPSTHPPRDDVPKIAGEVLEIVEVGMENAVQKRAELVVVVTAHDLRLVLAVSGEPGRQGRARYVEVPAARPRRTGTSRADEDEYVQERLEVVPWTVSDVSVQQELMSYEGKGALRDALSDAQDSL